MNTDLALTIADAADYEVASKSEIEALHTLAAGVRRLRAEREQMGTLPFEAAFLVHGEPEQLIFRGPTGQVVLRRLRAADDYIPLCECGCRGRGPLPIDTSEDEGES